MVTPWNRMVRKEVMMPNQAEVVVMCVVILTVERVNAIMAKTVESTVRKIAAVGRLVVVDMVK